MGEPSQRLEGLSMARWREIIGQSFAALLLEAPDEETFRADLRTVHLEDVHLFDMATGPHDVVRTAELVARDSGTYCKLSLQLEGSMTLSQDGRTCTLEPGDLGLYVAQRPYRLHYEHAQHSLVITFPQSFVQLSPAQVGRVTAIRVSQGQGLGRVAAPMFRELAGSLDILQGPHAMRLVRSALDMLVGVLSAEALSGDSAGADELLVQQASAYIEDHLDDPGLDPGRIASALYVSVRQLHSRFAAQGLTVSASLRARRLEAIRQDLGDPLLSAQTVHVISARRGLLDPAHVSRAFRAQFGETPSAYRRRVLGGQAQRRSPPGLSAPGP